MLYISLKGHTESCSLTILLFKLVYFHAIVIFTQYLTHKLKLRKPQNNEITTSVVSSQEGRSDAQCSDAYFIHLY